MVELRGHSEQLEAFWRVNFRFLAYLQTDIVTSDFIPIYFAFMPSGVQSKAGCGQKGLVNGSNCAEWRKGR